MIRHGLGDDPSRALVARRFALLADPTRLRLIHALFEGEKTVGALAQATGRSPANVSRHLYALARGGVLARRKAGLQVFYAIADPSIAIMCELVCGTLEQQLTKQVEAFAGVGPD